MNVNRFITLWCILGSCMLAETLESKLDALIKFQQPEKVVVLNYNPFATQSMMEKLQNNTLSTPQGEKSLRLASVLNNKAFISGDWYGVGDAIDGGKIIAISPTAVRIKRGTQVETLLFETSKKLLHVKDTQK